MTEGNGGVGAKWNPRVKQSHCACHSCAFCGINALKEVPELEIFNYQLHARYNFFALLVKRRAVLSGVQKRIMGAQTECSVEGCAAQVAVKRRSCSIRRLPASKSTSTIRHAP